MEIIYLNEQMEKDLSQEEYEAIFEQLEEIRDLLSDDQLEKLDKILEMLGRK
jgi:predicted house-cleaning noncanonical NTP pyrophosphatase (MazG superfamily)